MAFGAHSPSWKSIRGWSYLLLGLWSRPSPGSDFIYTNILARPRSGFLSTQRMWHGRDPGFIYATNSARAGSDFIYTKVKMGVVVVVNTISALCALILQTLLRPMREFWLTYKVVWSMVRSAYWGRGWWKSSVVDQESGFGGHNTFWWRRCWRTCRWKSSFYRTASAAFFSAPKTLQGVHPFRNNLSIKHFLNFILGSKHLT